MSAPISIRSEVGPPLFGFGIGLILYGISLLQTYQYFLNYTRDSRYRKLMVSAVCLVDSIHSLFTASLMYSALTSESGFQSHDITWSMKGIAVSKTSMIVLVQSFYLRIIRNLAGNMLLNRTLSRTVEAFSLMTFLYAIAISIAFLNYLQGIASPINFSVALDTMVYIAFGSTVAIDSAIAAVMSCVLLQSRSKSPEVNTSVNVVNYLVTFFVASGVLTAISAVLGISLYIARPSSVLYFIVEFTAPKLYANSILAMFNAKTRMQKRMEKTHELRVPSLLVFGEPEAANVDEEGRISAST